MAKPAGGGDSSGRSERQQQFRRRLRHSMLPLTNVPPPSPEVTEEEGAILFNRFMYEELVREELAPPPIPIDIPASHTQIYFASPTGEAPRYQNYAHAASNVCFDGPAEAQLAPPVVTAQNLDYRSMGRQIREFADEFASSPQGQKVKEKANEVNLENLNFNSFQELLSGVFHDGQFSRTTIIAVFVFCSTLVIRSLKAALTVSPKLIDWCFQFIKNSVCSVVQQEGGWDAVINGMFGRLFKVGATLAIASAALAAMFFIWKK